MKTNALRGYPLKGVDMKVPASTQGIVLCENESIKAEEAERELKFGGKFSQFTYWNYDKNPSENDGFRKALHWLEVSKAVSRTSDGGIFDELKVAVDFRFTPRLTRCRTAKTRRRTSRKKKA